LPKLQLAALGHKRSFKTLTSERPL